VGYVWVDHCIFTDSFAVTGFAVVNAKQQTEFRFIEFTHSGRPPAPFELVSFTFADGNKPGCLVFEDCFFNHSPVTLGNNITLFFDRCVFTGPGSSSSDVGLTVDGNVSIVNCAFRGFGTGVDISGGGNGPLIALKACGSNFTDCATGLTTTTEYVTCVNSFFRCTEYGLQSSSEGVHVKVVGCYFYIPNSGSFAIDLENVISLVITHCSVDGNLRIMPSESVTKVSVEIDNTSCLINAKSDV
jgi:hypothetical protein